MRERSNFGMTAKLRTIEEKRDKKVSTEGMKYFTYLLLVLLIVIGFIGLLKRWFN